MKKHPVDEFFKNQLDSLERTPSSSAWAKLEMSGAVKKNRKRAIWYALAAAVALVLLSGSMIWNAMQDFDNISQKALSNVNTPATSRKASNSPEKRELVLQEMSKPKMEAADTEPEKFETRKEVIQANQKLSPMPDKLQEALTITEKVEPILAVASFENASSELEKIEIENKPAVTSQKPDDRTVFVVVELAEQMEPKAKPGRFAKVFKQLKNARAGEKVDWEEVGFNPKTVIARIDDKLKHSEQKVSERYQDIKDKTKL